MSEKPIGDPENEDFVKPDSHDDDDDDLESDEEDDDEEDSR